MEILEQITVEFLYNDRKHSCHGEVLHLPIRGPVDGGRLLTETGL